MTTPDGGTDTGTMPPADSGLLPEDGGMMPDADPADAAVDLCADVPCENGTCTAGVCECDLAWGGAACDTPELPTDADLVLWLDFADLSTLEFGVGSDANKLARWTDKGPQALEFTPADITTNGPTNSRTIGRHLAASFDGIDDAIAAAGFTGLSSEPRYTIFVVAAAGEGDAVIEGSTGGDRRIELRAVSDRMLYGHRVLLGSDGVSSVADGRWTPAQPHVLTVQRTPVDTSIWIDGRERVEAIAGTPEALPGSALDLSLGAGSLGDALRGEVGEVLMFAGALDLETRAAVETYLSNKWLGEGIDHDLTSIAETALWLDAADDAAFTSSGGAVTSWASHDGSIVFDNGVGAQQPSRVAGALNGLPVVRFDGTDDSLSAADLGLVDRTDDVSIAAVVRSDSGDLGAIFFGVDDTNAPGVRLYANNPSGDFRFSMTSPPSNMNGDFVTAGVAPSTDPVRLVCRWGVGETMRMEALFAGAATANDSSPSTQPDLDEALTFVLGGKRPNHNIDNFAGDIAELIVFRRYLNAAELSAVQAYLDDKWGLR